MQAKYPILPTPTDGLTALLDTLSLHGAAMYRGRFSAPWGLSFAPEQEIGAASATFHMVLSGAGCLVTLADGESLSLSAGDFVLLPRSPEHVLTDKAQTMSTPIECAVSRGVITADDWLCFGGNGAQTETLCGNLFYAGECKNTPQSLGHPLLRALPSVIVLRSENGKPVPWLPATLEFLRCETTSGRPGYQTVVNRLAEILFIQAVRAHLADSDLGCTHANYLRAIADGRIAPALFAMHKQPAEPWSVASLATHCCLSRSAFAHDFTEQVGITPLAYLTQWRLFLAGRFLRGGERLTLSEIAARIGYGSEAALSKVFKQHIGVTPGEYRRRSEHSVLGIK
ncbi:MAG: AraC family transcriptional regulator [Fibrella sp.]|nr:AraC family transcriptional regulator [Armatimonadota bacterium]